jgi:16S rRNA (guanine966-N2)-methyltransferase
MAKRRLRVIAGTVGGRRLAVPERGARPTTDRVKESLFAALGETRLVDAFVLDLYAGSGALAIEALSRGADRAVLVESDPDAAAAITTNLATTELTDRARLTLSPVANFLGRPVPAEAPFTLAFLDPPYETPVVEVADALDRLARPGWLAPGGTVVLERPARGERPTLPVAWTTTWERAYGDTLVVVASVD